MAVTKYSDQISKLTDLLTTYSQLANETSPATMYATVLTNDTIQIDGAEYLSPLATDETPGTKIQVQIKNHQIVRVDNKTEVVENAYDDSDLKQQIENVSNALNNIVDDVTEANDNSANLFDRLTEYLNALVNALTEQDEINDEVGELLDELIDDLTTDLEEVKTLVDEVKKNADTANELAKEAYDGVYPITSEMRDLLGDLADLADLETAQTEEISGTYEREGEYSQAKAEYHYNESKSASRWSQTLTAELDAWAKDDEATRAKITEAKTKLETANTNLSAAQKAELEAEEKHKNMVKKYNVGYQLYLKAQTEGNTEKITAAKAIVDEASNAIYGEGCDKDSFSKIENALTTLEEKLKTENATTETCASEIAAVESALASYSSNTGSLYALLKSRYNVAIAEAEVGTAVYGIHELQSTTISQTANEIKLSASQSYVDSKINNASVSITANAVNTTISTLKSDGSLAKGTLIHDYNGGTLVCKIGNSVGCLTNANGSFDIVNVTWSGSTPTVASNAFARFSGTSVAFSNGVSFGANVTNGLFYVGKTITKTGTIAAGANSYKASFTYSELGGGSTSTDYLNDILPYKLRAVAPVRIGTNHPAALKITGWNYNPSITSDSDGSVLTIRVSRNGASLSSKMSVTIYVQTLWIRANITSVDDAEIDIDDGYSEGSGDSDLSGYLKGSLSGTTLTVTIV